MKKGKKEKMPADIPVPKKRPKLKLGDVIIWDPSNFNQNYWKNLSEKERKLYYGKFGYGRERKIFFVFICEINDAPGHCVIVNMEHKDKNKVITMAHISEFRKVTEEEF